MAYSNFTNKDLLQKFGVVGNFNHDFLRRIPPRTVSDLLKTVLADNVEFALMQGTEKARSEFIIAPILTELRKQAEQKISVFSGWELNVDAETGLTGRCDFLISRSPLQAVMQAPIVIAVEAKQQDFDKGTTQCIAEMIAARIFNEQEGNNIDEIYGIVTTGDAWRFLALRGSQAEIDPKLYSVTDIEQVFGIIWAMTFSEV